MLELSIDVKHMLSIDFARIVRLQPVCHNLTYIIINENLE